MLRLLSSLAGLAFIGICLTFALSNQKPVDVSLWPFDAQISAPLFLMVLGSLAIGLFCGGAFVWLQHLPIRIKTRRLGKSVIELSDRLAEAERELDKHRAEQEANQPPLLPGSKWRFWKKF